MAAVGCDACLVAARIQLYYLCGHIFDGWFWFPAKGEPVVFFRRPVQTSFKSFEVRKPEQIPAILAELGVAPPSSLMLEDDYLTMQDWTRLRNVFPDARPVSDFLREVRAVKTPGEVHLLRESAARHAGIYERIPGLFRDGMTDLEFSFEIEREARKLGHLGVMRIFGSGMEIHMGSVLAGDNALVTAPYDFAMGGAGAHGSLPIGPNGTVIRPGMTAMVDISGNFNGYLTDMTRVFAKGDVSPRAKELHAVSLEIQRELAVKGKAGVLAGDLFDAALAIISKHAASRDYMAEFQRTRFVGHGVGLEINELPVIHKGGQTVLEAGMTIALEPKFALHGTGPVGTENTYLVGEKGLEKLTVFSEEIIPLP
jgi:Xaa-Pro aminopeptidase